jgi:endonuclease/exonuclease/phosphatase family metal-dependent hydrolase
MNNRMDEAPAKAAMERILQAISPDIIGLSEVSNVSANYVRGLLNDWIPLDDGASWNVVKDDYDLMVASKGAVISTHAEVYRQFPVVIEAHPDWQVPMLFTSSHLKCCGGNSNEAQRQSEADEYMAFLRDAINGEGDGLVLSPNAPVVYGGDLNMVGLDNPIYTLVTGDIANENTNGPDFAPDWDGSSLTEWPILQSDHPFDYTWTSNSLSSEWIPGKLDYIITSDATADLKGGFVLRTDDMSPGRLSELGLLSGDALAASDHFIVVADLGLGGLIGYQPDSDSDGIYDSSDNCVAVANYTQDDFNEDGVGDACSDSDGDGLSDALELNVYNTDPLTSDTNQNGVSDGLELCLCSSNGSCPGDITNDLVVSVADLLALLGLFGATC